MGSLPAALGAGKITTGTVDSANSRGSTLTSHSTSHTKGSYTTLISSTAHSALGLLVNFPYAQDDGLMDIAVGAAASEQVIAPNLRVPGLVTDNHGLSVLLPLQVPAGSRISGRWQCNSGSSAIMFGHVSILAGGVWPGMGFSRMEAIGAVTASSKGTQVDPGGTIHTKGSYAQLTASTGFAYKALLVMVSTDNDATTSATNTLVDIAVGGAGSEVVQLGNLYCRHPANGLVIPPHFGPIPVNIPAGTRVAARAQSLVNTATDRELNVIAYGLG